jgi:hypothetical protein
MVLRRSSITAFCLLLSVAWCDPWLEGAAPTDSAAVPEGAASWIPEDAAWFSSTLRLGEQVRAVTGSSAFRRLLMLPAVQMLRLEVLKSEQWALFQEARETEPALRKGLEVLEDAFSREVFVWADAPLLDLLDAVDSIYFAIFLEGLRGGVAGTPPTPDAIARLLRSHEKALRVPPLVIGFRLENPARAWDLIGDILKGAAGLLPAAPEEEEIGGGRFRHLRLSGALLPPQALEGIGSTGAGAPLDGELKRIIRTRSLVVSAGVRSDYLLISLGPDTEHLKKLGSPRSLAASAALSPVRGLKKANLCSLSFLGERLSPGGKLKVDEVLPLIDRGLASLPQEKAPEKLRERLKKDAGELIADVNKLLPEAGPMVSAGFLNRGIETFEFSPWDPTLPDPGRPLEILERSGPNPLALIASRWPLLGTAHPRMVHWAKTAYGYFLDFVVPSLSPSDKREFDRFEKLFIPVLTALDEITATLLVPSIEGGEVLLAVQGGGSLPIGPKDALTIPRPSLVLELRDPAKFSAACARYRETLNRFFATASRELRAAPLEIPEFVARPGPKGTLYKIPDLTALVAPLPGAEPHALLGERYLIMGLWPSLSVEALSAGAPPVGEVVDLTAPAAQAVRLDIAGLAKLVLEDAQVLVKMQAASGSISPEQARLASAHIPELQAILGALRSYTSRIYRDGGLQVSHSWLEVRDCP